MNIITAFENPPIPIRGMDWSAVDADTYDAETNDPIGRGRTEREAINNLVEQLLEAEVEKASEMLSALEEMVKEHGAIGNQFGIVHARAILARLKGR